MRNRFHYLRRVFSSYLFTKTNPLSFWHGEPEVNSRAVYDRIGPYYMRFDYKADYKGLMDNRGVPMLHYHGRIGPQYNPIAVAQYGLAHYNRWISEDQPASRDIFLRQAEWLTDTLSPNDHGMPVWRHHFDFDYFQTLKSGWYSGLAQGQGLSMLLRAHRVTGKRRYRKAADDVFMTMKTGIGDGGVLYQDAEGFLWIEEYLVDPPTHILNGFIWALWGVYDYWLYTNDAGAETLFDACIRTISSSLHRYDTGYWSLYELSPLPLKMMASPFYHRLHIVQLDILYRMTVLPVFQKTANRWALYSQKKWNRTRSLAEKAIFKLIYY